MARIILLSDSLISRIAAGEVVERPASVVKELVENSIDAQATQIEIELIEGGTKLVKVTDNGFGMDQDDAVLSLKRHATSKISNEKLEGILTMGFRGEALASIAAVSRLVLRTRTDSQELGYEISIEAGNITNATPCACPRGTQIAVKDLFFNTPARKKHLKTISHELRQIIEIVTRIALAYTDISWKLWHNGDLIFSMDSSEINQRISDVFGASIADTLIPFRSESRHALIEGFISRPEYTRRDRRNQAIYVNRRYIKDEGISRAVYEGYRTMLGIGRHPVFILNITVPKENVDVNVHPAKLEVRLDKEELIHSQIMAAVKDSLVKEQKPREVSLPTEKHLTLENFRFKTEKQEALHEEEKSSIRILGQIRSTYAIMEIDEGLLIMDQHAAMERVLYEKFSAQYRNSQVESQNLLEPFVADLSPQEAVLVKANMQTIKRFGFSLEEFGRSAFLVKSIPMLFNRSSAPLIFNDLLNELQSRFSPETEDRIIKKACRASVKANTPLEIGELRKLFTELLHCQQPYTCPHGRPTLISYKLVDLEKMFKRTGF